MSDLVFPSDLPGLQLTVTRSPEYSTGVQVAASGQEYRALWYDRPRVRWRLAYEFLRSDSTYTEWQRVVSFFQRHAGAWDSFLFTDPDDHTIGSSGMLFGVGDGVTTAFQLQRTLVPDDLYTGTIWFSYKPGDSIEALDGVFARAGAARYVDADGVLQTAISGTLRDSHWIIPTGGSERVRTTLLEPAATNRCPNSEDFSAWSEPGTCTVTTNAIAAPDGTMTADMLTSAGIAGLSRRLQQLTSFTTTGTKTLSWYMKAGTSTQSLVVFYVTLSLLCMVQVDWAAGVPSLSIPTGTGTLNDPEQMADGWWRLSVAVSVTNTASTHEVAVFPGQASTGLTAYVWGVQVEDGSVPSSYITTAGSSASRVADSLYFNFGIAPATMTAYVSDVNVGNFIGSTSLKRYLSFGSSDYIGDPRFQMHGAIGGGSMQALLDAGAAAQVSQPSNVTPVMFDGVETRAVYNHTTETVIGAISKNGGTEAVGAPSPSVSAIAAWAAQRLYLAGLTSENGRSALRAVVVVAGAQSMATMREYAAIEIEPVRFWPDVRDGYEPVQEFPSAPAIYLAGVLQVEGTDYTIDDEGVVTFTAPPGALVPLRFTGSYYKRARFVSDRLSTRRLFSSMWEAADVELVQVI